MPCKLVSVVIPTYNRAHLIQFALESVLNQSFKDFELIIVDDGSSDYTSSIVHKFCSRYPNKIRYIYQKNRGPAVARNTGLFFATGKYVAFLDSDDLWVPEHLQIAINFLESHPDVHWFFGDLVRMKNQKIVVSSVIKQNGIPSFFKIMEPLDKDYYLIPASVSACYAAIVGDVARLQTSVVRKEVFSKIKFWDKIRVGEDKLIVFDAFYHGFNFVFHDATHGIFTIHDDHITIGKTKDSLSKKERVLQDLINVYLRILTSYQIDFKLKIALKRQLHKLFFWDLGYNTYLLEKQYLLALSSFYRGLRLWPFSFKSYKTFLIFLLKMLVKK